MRGEFRQNDKQHNFRAGDGGTLFRARAGGGGGGRHGAEWRRRGQCREVGGVLGGWRGRATPGGRGAANQSQAG